MSRKKLLSLDFQELGLRVSPPWSGLLILTAWDTGDTEEDSTDGQNRRRKGAKCGHGMRPLDRLLRGQIAPPSRRVCRGGVSPPLARQPTAAAKALATAGATRRRRSK
jgi:hypothetical protein